MKFKKVVSLFLVGMSLASLVSCGAVPEKQEENKVDELVKYSGELSVTASKENVFGVTDEKSNEIWDWAETCYQDWLPRYQTLLERKKNETAPALLKEDSSEWNRTIYSDTQWTWQTYSETNNSKKRMTRTISSLKNWTTSTQCSGEYLTDTYGGLIDASMKQEATGAYYVAKINGRWWMIDPLGYPMYVKCVIGAVYSYNGNKTQANAAISRYGSEEKWAIATKFALSEDFGFNVVTSWSKQTAISEVAEPLASYRTVYSIVYYGVDRGIARKSGSSVFDQADNVANNTMPVFDPEYMTYADEKIKAAFIGGGVGDTAEAGIVGDKSIMYYHLDNEIPMNTNMLERSLTLDPSAEVNGVKVNMYTYACAWTWFRHMTGKDNASVNDITDELSEIYRGFVYDRFYAVTVPLCKKYDDGTHLNAGVRFLTGPDSTSVVKAEWVIRFASLWTDIISINWYKQWTPTAKDLQNLTLWSGDMPFVVSEFAARSEEAGTVAGVHSAAAAGGWYVKDDSDQAAFFENFTLRMLEWKNNIGYCWYRYSNYWIGETWQSGSGIVTDEHEWRPVAYSMQNLNKNIYGLIEFLDERQK